LTLRYLRNTVQTHRINARTSVSSAGYLCSTTGRFICTRAHDTTRDGRRRRTANFSFRFASQMFPVRNNYCFTGATATAYKVGSSRCESEILYFPLKFFSFFFPRHCFREQIFLSLLSPVRTAKNPVRFTT